MSDFHPESWNPLWSVSTILTGLLSFMVETQHTTGAVVVMAAAVTVGSGGRDCGGVPRLQHRHPQQRAA